MRKYDVIVVGAGSSGGALAARLSENPERSVLLLEAGPAYRSVAEMAPELLQPSNIAAAAPGHPNNWSFAAQMRPGLTLPYPRGKGLGGSSTINGCYFIRGTRADFDRWAGLGNDEWGFDQVLPVFKRLEHDRDFSGEYHGASGPIPVTRDTGLAPELASAFEAACLALGFPRDPDKNAPSGGGVGPVPLNVADGRRVGSALAYLLPAAHRPNLHVVGGALVERVLLHGRTAIGVQAVVDRRTQTFHADEVVLAAGALRTPQLLMLSGIGPEGHLREHGIEVLQALPGVGQNLTDHAMVTASWEAKAPLSQDLTRGPVNPILHWEVDGSDMEVIPFLVRTGDMIGVADVGRRPLKALHAMRRTSIKAVTRQIGLMRRPMLAVVMLQQDSRGTVTLRSADPLDHPVLDWNLLSAGRDRARLREGVRVAAELFGQRPLRDVRGAIPGLSPSELNDQAALDAWIDERIGAGHPCCTCRMGPASDPMAVVDQRLRVHGVDHLRIADTSVFPTIPSRGPNATAFMAGERAADFLSA